MDVPTLNKSPLLPLILTYPLEVPSTSYELCYLFEAKIAQTNRSELRLFYPLQNFESTLKSLNHTSREKLVSPTMLHS